VYRFFFGIRFRPAISSIKTNMALAFAGWRSPAFHIQSIYELGLEPTFWQPLEPQKLLAPKMAWA